jgi:L-fuculose-phosphate aldolase
VRLCRRLDERGLVAGAEGNVSVRVGDRLLVTPAGARKGEVKAADCVVLEIASGVVRGRGAASTEVQMHLAIYRSRDDVNAVVHAHPPTATGFAVARRPIPAGALAEVAGVLGRVPLVEYHRPGTGELGAAVAAAMRGADAALLANHGAVTVGPDPTAALNLMESLEQAARILVSAHILGGVTELHPQEVLELDQGRQRSRLRGAIAATPPRRRN